MNIKPLVSVTLVAMNHEKFIIQACQSIINQTYKNIEIIFLDNNSEDKTYELGSEFLKNSGYRNKCIKTNFNKGISENLNTQINLSNGEFISILSGDDWYENQNIEKRLNFLVKNNLDVIYADGYKFIEKTSQKIDLYTFKQKNKVKNIINSCYDENLTRNLIYSVGFFCKKEILLQNPFDNDIYAEDWDINLRLAQKGFQFGFVDEKLFNYRILENSLSNNKDIMQKAYFQITNKHIEKINSYKNLQIKHNLNILDFKINNNRDLKKDSNLHLKLTIQKNNLKYKSPKKQFKNILSFFKYLININKWT
jgi:teichuronic acid biosynthesis glycosyltransferase TuaG